jgi:hypothetical protein
MHERSAAAEVCVRVVEDQRELFVVDGAPLHVSGGDTFFAPVSPV